MLDWMHNNNNNFLLFTWDLDFRPRIDCSTPSFAVPFHVCVIGTLTQNFKSRKDINRLLSLQTICFVLYFSSLYRKPFAVCIYQRMLGWFACYSYCARWVPQFGLPVALLRPLQVSTCFLTTCRWFELRMVKIILFIIAKQTVSLHIAPDSPNV